MYGYNEEMFLKEYFIYEAVVGRFCDKRALLAALGDIYMLAPDKQDAVYKVITGAAVCDIRSEKDFKQYQRLRQYSEAVGSDLGYTDDENALIAIKGIALTDAEECGLTVAGNMTEARVYSNLIEKANCGVVTALRMLGVLQSEGIFTEKNVKSGIKNLLRAARWNSVESMLALLKYDPDTRAENLAKLGTLAAETPFGKIAAQAAEHYGGEPAQPVKECVLLSKAFGRGQLKSAVYMPVCANLLYSDIIRFKDKENLLLAESKDAMASTLIDLPLKLTLRNIPYDGAAIDRVPVLREGERDKILRSAANSDLRAIDTYRPLCLSSDSGYMTAQYARAITQMYAGAHVERIEINGLDGHDLDPTNNNIFVRSIDEDKNNVFLLFFNGDIKEPVMNEVLDFIDSAKRTRFQLVHPKVVLDLGAILPICFCDKSNERELAKHCDIVSVDKLDRRERGAAILALLGAKELVYGTGHIETDEPTFDKLCALDTDDAETALDRAICAYRGRGEPLRLTESNMREYLKNSRSHSGFGYGGAVNENK